MRQAATSANAKATARSRSQQPAFKVLFERRQEKPAAKSFL
jgi:hypothetical protein